MNIEVDITGVVLKTERLVLREWKESDLQDFSSIARWKASEKWQVGRTMKTSKNQSKFSICL